MCKKKKGGAEHKKMNTIQNSIFKKPERNVSEVKSECLGKQDYV